MRFLFLIILFFIIFPQHVFASDFQVSGKILDSNNNPVSQGVVVFVDASGKTIAAATSGIDGLYHLVVPSGKYTLSVEGPKGSGLQKVEFTNQIISSPLNFDFTLIAPSPVKAQKPALLQTLVPVLTGLLVVLGAGILFWRKKKANTLSQPRSSH